MGKSGSAILNAVQAVFPNCSGSTISLLSCSSICREEPCFHLPFMLLTQLLEIDAHFMKWRCEPWHFCMHKCVNCVLTVGTYKCVHAGHCGRVYLALALKIENESIKAYIQQLADVNVVRHTSCWFLHGLPTCTRYPCHHGTENDWQPSGNWWVFQLWLPQSYHWVRAEHTHVWSRRYMYMSMDTSTMFCKHA